MGRYLHSEPYDQKGKDYMCYVVYLGKGKYVGTGKPGRPAWTTSTKQIKKAYAFALKKNADKTARKANGKVLILNLSAETITTHKVHEVSDICQF